MQEKMHRICCLETKHAGGKTKEERRQELILFGNETKMLQKKSDETKNWTEKVADRRLEEIGCRI